MGKTDLVQAKLQVCGCVSNLKLQLTGWAMLDEETPLTLHCEDIMFLTV